jgi:hypothetical protein
VGSTPSVPAWTPLSTATRPSPMPKAVSRLERAVNRLEWDVARNDSCSGSRSATRGRRRSLGRGARQRSCRPCPRRARRPKNSLIAKRRRFRGGHGGRLGS